ncbi:MAG: enoyl-CoA hydratase/isomerase family protein [Planctomycetes bacterium]|nr:enoyl-CoA hydratase/isomerase family protein [Planctomycetota bacterium]
MARSKCAAIRVTRRAGVTAVRLSRAERYNALDNASLQGLADVLEQPTAGPLVLSGEGDIFSVGPDIDELSRLDGAGARTYSLLAHRVCDLLERWPGVTIAHIAGYCLGSGLELALACDVVAGQSGLRIGMPGLAWAMVPCMGGLARLGARVAAGTTSRLFLNGDVLEAPEAERLRLIDRQVGSSAEVDDLARDMAEWSPSAVTAIRSLRLARRLRIDVETEAALFAQPFATGECQKRLKELLAG